jgi:hypothetical protein
VKPTRRSIVTPRSSKKLKRIMRLRIVCICVAALAAGARAQPAEPPVSGFVTSAQCIACHTNLTAPSGEDISIGFDWRATMMANSARDPYWHAAVRREVTDHPTAQAAIEDKCSTCHMPMARTDAAAAGGRGEVFASLVATAPQHALAADGVSCTVCHQIAAEGLGEHASFDGGYQIARSGATPVVFGPHDVDPGRQSVMRSATNFTPSAGAHLQQSEICATCHTLYTTALDEAGQAIGSLAEQVPYQEWLHSDYRSTHSCQSCHMPEVASDTPIASVLGQPRPRVSQHTFHGGNAFMLRILSRYRAELGVTALPQELEAAIRETERYLAEQTATVTIDSVARTGSELDFEIAIASSSGHKLPTAYPSRRVWLHVVVRDAAGRAVFESGAVGRNGAIAGNDNDLSAESFEPHYDEITSPEQVQIYESIMVDQRGDVTTGLLRGVRYAKDNRLLPRGFDKGTADAEVAVHGDAASDVDFTAGGDRVRYRVGLAGAAPGPLSVAAELRYQSIGYRWAENLRGYEAAEPQRFLRYYAESAAASAVTLATAGVQIAGR